LLWLAWILIDACLEALVGVWAVQPVEIHSTTASTVPAQLTHVTTTSLIVIEKQYLIV